MQIIIVPDNASRQSRCFRNKFVFFTVFVFALVIPVAVGIGAYHLGVSQTVYQPSPEQLRLAFVQSSLDGSKRELEEVERVVEQQLDTLGRRLGHVQAHVARLNALGKRLTTMASLESEEFKFDAEPAMGGPESDLARNQTAADLISALDALEASVSEKRGEIEILETLLMDMELHSKQFPNGWPVSDGWISSGYGYRNDPFTGKRDFHKGVDIASKSGLPITAVAAGVVTVSTIRPGYGVVVEINHGNGYTTSYAHAMVSMVEVGERVEKDDIIAVVGSTGRSTGAHVHFEVLLDGKSVNPHKYLSASL